MGIDRISDLTNRLKTTVNFVFKIILLYFCKAKNILQSYGCLKILIQCMVMVPIAQNIKICTAISSQNHI